MGLRRAGEANKLPPGDLRHPDAYWPVSGAAGTSVRGAGIECDKQRRQECAMTKAKHQVLRATRREPIDSAACGTHRG